MIFLLIHAHHWHWNHPLSCQITNCVPTFWCRLPLQEFNVILLTSLVSIKQTLDGPRYDKKREKLHFFDRTFHHLLFCQTPNFLNVLSKMLFCQNKANNVLSKFIKILSNSDGYLDSLLFCQSLQSCLTEQF